MGPSPARKLIPIRSELLQPGMYVAELDRSWLHSPFTSRGLFLSSPEQIRKLQQSCRYVYVDPSRGEAAPAGGPAARPAASRMAPVGSARHVLRDVLATIAGVLREAHHRGGVDVGAVMGCAALLVDQFIHRAEPVCWLLRMDASPGFACRRAAGTAITAVALGRQIGLDLAELRALAAGGLLLDIGKVAVPVPILAKPGPLEGGEQAYVRRHVERSLELVAGGALPEHAMEMIAAHHERLDGTGYPRGLHGTEIPLFGRIAAIADAYDAMTLNRRYAAAISPHSALRQLAALREEKFDAALVDELVLALGPYPVGSVVELGDGSVGLVCGQRPAYPLRPHVIITHDARRQPLSAPQLSRDEAGADIRRSLPPNAVQLDPARLEAVLGGFHSDAA